ncbi:MAG: bifunctional shikimate kinase/3-dehydroquinate synthase [Acidobacteriota bacterium]
MSDESHRAGAPRDLVLSGPMGAGKSTVGKQLARCLSLRFSDLDRRIVEREERQIAALFAEGEARFRQAEAGAVQAWLNRPASAPPEVLALGGGTLENSELAEALERRATIVGLSAPVDELLGRLDEAAIAARPLLSQATDRHSALTALIESRRQGYSRAAVQIDTSGLTAESVVIAVLRALYSPQSGPWRTEATPLCPAEPSSQSVTFGRGAVPFVATRRAALLWDSNLPSWQSQPLLQICRARVDDRLIELPQPGGEAAKTPEVLLSLWRTLLQAGVDKDTPLWVAGGGTLTDLGGFVAHSFKRGLELQLLPTTLLGQLDAALGGKNGINLDTAKNAIGTTRLPHAVHIDPLFLLSLPEPEVRGAMAEALKSGLIGDPGLVATIERETPAISEKCLPVLESIAQRAAAVKLQIVARDLDEKDERRLLNFGHTLGHALETVGARRGRPIAHGDAVAIGMVFATYLAARLGVLEESSLLDRLPGVLKRLGLPSAPAPMRDDERHEVLAALMHDKKRHSGVNVWVLPRGAGRLVCRTVDELDVAQTLEQFT